MAGERGNEEAKKKKEWNDGDATLHSMPASRILPLNGKGDTNHIRHMRLDQVPLDRLGEKTVQVCVMDVWIRAEEFEVFPISDPGHQRDSEQMGQAKNGGALRLCVAMHRIWSDRLLLFLKHIEDIRPLPDTAWDEVAEKCDVRI